MIKRAAGVLSVSLLGGVLLFPAVGVAQSCGTMPLTTAAAGLQGALDSAVSAEGNLSPTQTGLHNQMWATIVDRNGIVCAVVFSGGSLGAQWPGSRVISAQKANTANAFSLDHSSFSNGAGQNAGLALSTANLYSAVQPGGSLYGLQHSNPVDTAVAYGGKVTLYGTGTTDPMVTLRIGGVNVFGGGLALYTQTGNNPAVIVGGLGVSGDTSCEDHFVAWRVRSNLGLDHLVGVGGVSGDPTHPDNIIFDITPNSIGSNSIGGTGVSASGFGHPTCLNLDSRDPKTSLPVVQ